MAEKYTSGDAGKTLPPGPVLRLDDAVAALAGGGVVAYPSETYYALGADPRQPRALREVLLLKGRDAADKPLLLLIDSLDAVERWAEPAAGFEALARRFWPGPLTLVLPAAPGLAAPLVGPGGGVALRLTAHATARELIGRAGGALTGTSANRTGVPPARTAAEVARQFDAELAAIVDAGATPGGPPSTLLDLTVSPAAILRPGAVPAEALGAVVRLL